MARVGLQSVEGYAFGAIQPTALLQVPSNTIVSQIISEKMSGFLDIVGSARQDEFLEEVSSERYSEGVARLFNTICSFAAYCGDARFSKVRIFEEDNFFFCALPTISTEFIQYILFRLLKLLDANLENESDLVREIEDAKSRARSFLPGGTNSANFIAAAALRKIPFKILQRRYLVFGYGGGSTIFNSSITESESSVGVSFARSKIATNELLRLSGLPVAEQWQVRTIERAKEFARKFGYPVVLKPENGSQGRGIYANIGDEAELVRCFEKASQSGDVLLLEKHVAGDHYRVNYMGDTLMMALRRRAAEVTGDGRSTVRELVEELNREPERLDPNTNKAQVSFDEDLGRCLLKQKIALDDVPEVGRQVYLRSISNRSRGGSQVHVEDRIHPENLELCKQIGRIMRLDVMGIDLLSPDLSQPWYSNGTVICEVNAQPQLGYSDPEFYWSFMKRYLRPRIPVNIRVTKGRARAHPPLFDTAVFELNITLSASDLLRHGCPVQYFDSLEFEEDVPQGDREKLERLLVSVMPIAES